MKLFKRRKPSPALIVAIAALSVSLVGTAVAVPVAEISLNKGEKKQIRKIARKMAKKISKRTSNQQITKRAPGLFVGGAHNAGHANTAGAANHANSASSANEATTAGSLAGQTPFYVRLGFGQSKTLAANGTVSLIAVCDQEGGNDRARIVMQTTQNGAVANGSDEFDGEDGDTLDVGVPINERVFVENTVTSGKTNVEEEIDEGFLIGPDNKMLTANSEGIALGLNYRGSGCLFAGIINAVN